MKLSVEDFNGVIMNDIQGFVGKQMTYVETVVAKNIELARQDLKNTSPRSSRKGIHFSNGWKAQKSLNGTSRRFIVINTSRYNWFLSNFFEHGTAERKTYLRWYGDKTGYRRGRIQATHFFNNALKHFKDRMNRAGIQIKGE